MKNLALIQAKIAGSARRWGSPELLTRLVDTTWTDTTLRELLDDPALAQGFLTFWDTPDAAIQLNQNSSLVDTLASGDLIEQIHWSPTASSVLRENPVYRDRINQIASSYWTYERPVDWPALPVITEDQQRFAGLVAVFPTETNFLSLDLTTYVASGTYQVDWGDGVVDIIVSGQAAHHNYDYSTLASPVTSRGYKTALVQVQPLGNHWVQTFRLAVKHPLQTGGGVNSISPWLDIHVNFPRMTTLNMGTLTSTFIVPTNLLEKVTVGPNWISNFSWTFGGTTVHCANLQVININTKYATTFERTFENCFSLKIITGLDISGATTTGSALFAGCSSLEYLPYMETKQVSGLSNAISRCYALKRVPLWDTRSVTSFANFFSDCFSLTSIPYLDMSKVASTSSMFSGCRWLEYVPAINTSGCNNTNSMFSSCFRLKTVPPLDLSRATTTNSMFANCYNLRQLPALDTSRSGNTASMFSGCNNLQSVPVLDLSRVSDTSSMFANCNTLTTVGNLDLSVSTNLNSMFSGCVNLRQVGDITAALAASSNNMFDGCVSLESVGNISSPLNANINLMFSNCHSLRTTGEITAAAVASTGLNAFTNTFSKTRLPVTGARFSISFNQGLLSRAALQDIFTRLGRADNTSQVVTITNNWGADAAVSKTASGTTSGSTTVTLSNTSGLETGMWITGTGISTAVSATVDIATSTFTRNGHGIPLNTPVSLATAGSISNLATYTTVWVVNPTTNTFQVAAAPAGEPLTLTGSNSSVTLLYGTSITEINPNVSITISIPASATGSVTTSSRRLNTSIATLKGWTVTG